MHTELRYLEEIFDICDAEDRVIGQAPRAEVHARKLLHRAVHIWVFNSSGELLLHLRSASKDEYPLCWTSSASGHLAAGEDYHTAAVRELAEELGLNGPLEYVGRLSAGANTAYEHTALYTLTTDSSPCPDPGEIAEIRYLPMARWEQLLAEQPEQFSPPAVELLRTFGRQFRS